MFVEAGENDNLIVQKLEANPDAFGIFGFSFLDQNGEKVKGAEVDGVAPSFDAIADGDVDWRSFLDDFYRGENGFEERLENRAAEIETIQHETLILWGAQDPFQDIAYGRRLAEALAEISRAAT